VNWRTLDEIAADHGIGRTQLSALLEEASLSYDGARYWAGEAKRIPSNLHELREPLSRAIDLMGREGNWPAIAEALAGGPAQTDARAARATRRYNLMMRWLDAIYRATPTEPPPHRSRGKPPRAAELRELVGGLLEFWKREKGAEPRLASDFSKRGTPAGFVHDVVAAIDPAALRKVKSAYRWVVYRRRGVAKRARRTDRQADQASGSAARRRKRRPGARKRNLKRDRRRRRRRR